MTSIPRGVTVFWAFVVGTVAVAASGCSGGPTGPSSSASGPTLSCPAPQSVPSVNGNDVSVMFPLATASGGTAPVAVTCSPASGSLFSVGTSNVTCSGVDAAQKSASCTFTVTVQGPPKLSVTRFLAFGDSITEGKDGNDPAGGLLPNGGYPGFLQDALAARYLTQTITIAHAGCGGEGVVTPPQSPLPCNTTSQGTGVARLPATLDLAAPDVLLLLEGINDLFDGDPAEIPFLIDGLRQMVVQARNRNAKVVLATLTPLGPSAHSHASAILPTVNDQIKQLAVQQGAVVVDLYAAFGGTADPFIGSDGLHPNAAGYQKIAATFFDAIRANFEVKANGQRFGPIAPGAARR